MVRMRYGETADGKASNTGTTYTETVLWSNPDRTATFAEQDVTLSQSVNSFKYLRVVYAYTTTSEDSSFREVIIPVWNSGKTAYMYQYAASSDTGYRAALCLKNSSNVTRARTFWILNSGTEIHFFACRNVGSSGTGNTGCIPVYIYGIK